MSDDLNHGTGDADHFPAADLEKLYVLGARDPSFRIRGSQLNAIVGGTRYVNDGWYVVDGKNVRRL